ncbi:MAG: RelA/SpoT domain-containing protein [Bacteroidota bacterium]
MRDLELIYTERYENALIKIADFLEKEMQSFFKDLKRVDRIYARAKSVDRFLSKADKIENSKPKYTDPINQIQDQVGARIITFYLNDVESISKLVSKFYTPIERKSHVPDSEREFGYEGKHFILLMPTEITSSGIQKKLIPNFFELQIKTLYQHAFSEASHDLAYKPGIELTKEQKRKVAFTAAQSWGADLIFNDLQKELCT